MFSKIIRNFIAKRVAGRSDDGIMISLKDPKKVDFQAAMMEDLLMRNGIDPRAITSEAELKMLLNQISKNEASRIRNMDVSGIRGTRQADVFDLEGNKIPQGSRIMGGKAVDDDLPPPGSRGGPDDIAAPVQSQEETLRNMTEAEIKANLEKQNKDSVQRILDRKNREDVYGLEDYDTTNMSEIKKEIIRTETKLGNLNPNNPGFRERAKPLIDKIEALKNKMKNDPEKKADGGRIGFRVGSGEGKDTSGRDYASDTAASRSVATSPSRDTGGGGDNTTYDYSYPKEIVKQVATNTAKNLARNKIVDVFGLSKFSNPLGIAMVLRDFYNQTQNPQITEEEMQYEKGGRVGFFMGSKFPKGLAALRQMLQYYGKKSDVVKNPSDILKMTNPNKVKQMLEDPAIYNKFDVKEGIGAPETLRNIIKQKEADRIEMVEEMLGSARNIRKADEDAMKYKNDMIEDMMKKGIDKETAKGMAETITKMAEDAGLGKFKDTPKLTKEGVLELENILKNMKTGGKDKRSLNADGGRIGLKDGPKMTRRTFLKYLTGLAAIPIVGKIVKPLKTVKGVKNVPIIKTSDVKGKPEWFDQLVNKVIIEGDDVTKQLGTVEREIVHTKKLNDTDEVTVYQDLNTDSIRVEYKSPDNMMEEPVDLSYKKTPPDEGNPKGSADFEATEMGYVGRADGPDDYFIDAEEVGGSSIKDLDSDVSALKEYATGKGPTMKEIVEKKKRKDKVKKLNEGDLEAQSEYVIDRQGDAYDYDNYASGGIARMLGE